MLVGAQGEQAAQAARGGLGDRGVQRHHVLRAAHAQRLAQHLQRVLGLFELGARDVVAVQHVAVLGQQHHAVIDFIEHLGQPACGRRCVGAGALAGHQLQRRHLSGNQQVEHAGLRVSAHGLRAGLEGRAQGVQQAVNPAARRCDLFPSLRRQSSYNLKS